MIKTLRTSVLGLLALPLAAQGAGFSLAGGLLAGSDSLKKATNQSSGFLLGADYGTRVIGTEVPARLGLAFASMPGKESNGLKTSLALTQLHGDVFIDTGSPSVHGLVGLSLNHYSMSRTGTESADPADVDHHFPVRDASGMKLGLRVGAAFTVSDHWSLEVLYQQTELAGKDLSDPQVRRGGVNPGWFELDLRWRF
ncbi:outer membrane beta-barrel protein [Geothrix sp. PMB-07]|uniref:outer membrane beta-barrel protein n=1 Tax=Geothrix sp. PMB-07 TaxID=3068640 RepID=UPI0027409AF2|nr:outer membrane beta-barrel protein [Geothrix sp. PMB-07]WLT33467.1 outer membrane beta-barrel protein [Geothrix sp. PMB-07]